MAIDTHRLCHKLRDTGMSEKQAEAIAFGLDKELSEFNARQRPLELTSKPPSSWPVYLLGTIAIIEFAVILNLWK